jgi:hypothetical protein
MAQKHPTRTSHTCNLLRQALLHLVGPRHGDAATMVWRQIALASSSDVTRTRRVIGTSTASS